MMFNGIGNRYTIFRLNCINSCTDNKLKQKLCQYYTKTVSPMRQIE
jgi:hypothetical protein